MTKCYLNALGILSALGTGKEETLTRLLKGDTSGVCQKDDIQLADKPLQFGFYPGPLMAVPKDLANFASRNTAMALTALQQIEGDVSAAIKKFGNDRMAVVIGTSTSGIEEGENALENFKNTDKFPDHYHFLQQEMSATGEALARFLKLAGPVVSISTACSSSGKVFETAQRLLDQDLVDAVLVGGVDTYCRLTVNGFSSLSALHDGRGCLPFSRNRTGTVLGEGAALFLMTKDAGGCQLGGVGSSSDAYKMTAPDPTGKGAALAMQRALADAGLQAKDISYLNLHGTGTVQNDLMEARAVADIFGDRVPFVSSTKPLTGHTLGAAGALEAAFCWLILSSENTAGRLPLHFWDNQPDPDIVIQNFVTEDDTLPGSGPKWCMSNSYAFGGSNVSVILKGAGA